MTKKFKSGLTTEEKLNERIENNLLSYATMIPGDQGGWDIIPRLAQMVLEARGIAWKTIVEPSGNDKDCPKHIIEVRRRDDGTLDEIVSHNCMVHLEEMDENCTWLGVYKGDYRQSTFISAVIEDGKAVLKYSSFMDDSPEMSKKES